MATSYPKAPLALNVKADGLQKLLVDAMRELSSDRLFAFDMSVPDMLKYLDTPMPVYARASEYENPPALVLARVHGVWLDAFRGDWFTRHTVLAYRELGLQVCLVSPELHQRPHLGLWAQLKAWGCAGDDGIQLCTDFPDDAKAYFS